MLSNVKIKTLTAVNQPSNINNDLSNSITNGEYSEELTYNCIVGTNKFYNNDEREISYRLVRNNNTSSHGTGTGSSLNLSSSGKGGRSRGGSGGNDLNRTNDFDDVYNNGGGATNLTSKSSYNKMDLKAQTISYNLPEDLRISKLLRRLSAENNLANALDLCEKLKSVVVDTSNSSYIRKSFDFLVDAMITIFKTAPPDCYREVAKIFGMMGFVARNDFPVYRSWVQRLYRTQKPLQMFMMTSMLETLKMDSIALSLRDYSGSVMEMLKDFLEAVDIPELFVSIIEVIEQLCKNYPSAVQPHFTDIVDIVVGWHLEPDQTQHIKQHCSIILQEFKVFWKKDHQFTLSLLGQFLEDINSCGDDLLGLSNDLQNPEKCFGSFVGSFNTVIKCLSVSSPDELIGLIGKNLINESFVKIMTVGLLVFNENYDAEVVITLNEYISIVLDFYGYEGIEIDIQQLFTITLHQIKHIHLFSDEQIICLLITLLRIVNVVKIQLTPEFIMSIINPKSNLLQIRYKNNINIQKLLVKIYQELLNLKNVQLLQETYKNILTDLLIAFKTFPGTENIEWNFDNFDGDLIEKELLGKYSIAQAEFVINFYLVTLSKLSTTNSSIMAMWTLKPNILSLLSVHLEPANSNIWKTRLSALHNSILNLIFQHCYKNNFFVGSSKLLNGNSTTVIDVFNKLSIESTALSPTSEHFEIILKFLSEIIDIKMCYNSLSSLLDFTNAFIQNTIEFEKVLYSNKNYLSLLSDIVKLARKTEFDKIILKCGNCVENFVAFNSNNFNNDLLITLTEVSCYQMCSNNHVIRDQYSNIFSKIPLRYSLRQVDNYVKFYHEQTQNVNGLLFWHQSSSTINNCVFKPEYFKEFINRITFSAEPDPIEDFIEEIFINCWNSTDRKSNEFCTTAMRDVRCLINWIQWEAAQYCVNNKMRTLFGKPQDTFLKIESIIKENARILALKKNIHLDNIASIIENQKRARILIGFLDTLEKAIYNASEGTAFAMQPAEKPARTFFRINAPTCNEWFNRNRTAVDLVALHAMEPEIVIRYSEMVLKNLTNSKKTDDILFEHTLLSLSWALNRTGESDALFGLYIWCKKKVNRKIYWIKMMGEQTLGNRELAADGYQSILATEENTIDPTIREFIYDQLVLCLLFSRRYTECHKIVAKEEARGEPRLTIPMLMVNTAQMENCIVYHETRDVSLMDLANWEALGDYDKELTDFSYHKLISIAENTIVKLSMTPKANLYDDDSVKHCTDVIQKSIQECLRTKSNEHLSNLVILNHILHKITIQSDWLHSFEIDKSFGSITLLRMLSWVEYYIMLARDDMDSMNTIRLRMASVARKECNLKICEKELTKFFIDSDYTSLCNITETLTFDKVKSSFIQQSNGIVNPEFCSERMIRGLYESCKFLYCYPEKRNDALQLASATSIAIIQRLDVINTETPYLREYSSRILLTLSEWLQVEQEKVITTDQTSPLVRLLASLPDIKPYPEDLTQFVPIIENSIGKLLQFGVKQCPDLAKAWFALGNWSYRWGRKMVEQRNEDNDKAGLRIGDVSAIANLIPNSTNTDIEQIVSILNQHQVSVNEEVDIDTNVTSSTEIIEKQLRNVEILKNYSQDKLHSIVDIWRQAHKTVYGYYEMSADAYFKYLQLAIINDDNVDNCSSVTATLRLLRLIVKHALGLQEVLEEGLATTPTNPWKIIIPQLFSRMNHHELYVRSRVSDLLCRVAKDAPHLIIFPTVVGAVQGQKTDLADISITTADQDFEDDLSTNDISMNDDVDSGLIYCFNSLLDTLSKEASETVNQVQLLVRELKRITLLWDELWLVTLAQIYSEWLKRFNSFDNYTKKFKDYKMAYGVNGHDNLAIISGKYNIMMKPVIFVMERLYEMTSRKPETNNEQIFQEKFLSVIEETIKELKKPFNPERPHDTWQKFKSLYGLLQHKSQRKSSSTLKMMDISPVLAQLKDTVISMPGVETSSGIPVYIK